MKLLILARLRNIDIDGTFFLVDPLYQPLILWLNTSTSTLLKLIIYFITHAHADHIADVEAIAKRTGAQLITNPEILAHFEALGLSGHSMNLGGSHRFVDGKVKIKND